jgi:hypothetical protein
LFISESDRRGIAYAYHQTNKPEVKANLEKDGWIVTYSKEFSHDEYLKLAAAIVADVAVTKGGATTVYFSEFASDSLRQIIKEVQAKAPQALEAVQQGLTPEKLLSAIRTSFNGDKVTLSLGGVNLEVGRATYNRAECTKIPLLGKKCITTPNTYQPYIRFQVASS